MVTDGQTDRRTTTVTLAAHARRGLIREDRELAVKTTGVPVVAVANGDICWGGSIGLDKYYCTLVRQLPWTSVLSSTEQERRRQGL